jgi:hypothetical protein
MTCNVHVMHVITCNNILGVSLMQAVSRAGIGKPGAAAETRHCESATRPLGPAVGRPSQKWRRDRDSDK